MPDMIHNSYMAHGYCMMWKPWLVGLHGLSDVLIALSYFAIPLAIWIFMSRRNDLEMRGLAWMFVAFITLCGMTHIVGLVTLWTPIYEIEGWIKGATAVVSVFTAIAIFPLIPKALAIPSPSSLQAVNTQLVDEIAAHKRTLAELEQARAQLEQRVEERTSALNESQAFLKNITDIAPTILYVYDLETGENVWINKNVASMLGYDPEELQQFGGDLLPRLMHPDDYEHYKEYAGELTNLEKGETVEFEYRLRHKNGEWRWMLSQDMAYARNADGAVRQIIGAAYDISDRKDQEERIKLLMREVNHRSKNLLTVVQSIARQTAKKAEPARFADELSQRLYGLAASQDLIVQSDWLGVGMEELIRSQIAHLDKDYGARLLIEGAPVSLSPEAAQGIGMAIHELSTNALKYGALSGSQGNVSITWRIEPQEEGDRFIVSWTETGGPAVSTPESDGFGRTVIERMAAHAVDGTVILDYAPDGVKWTLSAPLENVQTDTMKAMADNRPVPGQPHDSTDTNR